MFHYLVELLENTVVPSNGKVAGRSTFCSLSLFGQPTFILDMNDENAESKQ